MFSPAYAQFFADLTANNDREWFTAHKRDYETLVYNPAQVFVTALGQRLQELIAGLRYETGYNGSVMRIHRDTRFSPDKSPYKTNLGMMFWHGEGKKMERPGYYVHLDATGGFIAAGHYIFPKPHLARYREAIMDDKLGAALEQAVAAVGPDYEIGMQRLKKVPRGFEIDHPRAEWLRYDGLIASTPPFDVATVTRADFVEVCFEHCRNTLPVMEWLIKVL